MDFVYWTSLIKLLLLCKAVQSAFVPDGVYRTECRDRFFMIAVNLSFAGQEPYFEAVDETGVFPITEQYAAQCGYTAGILIVPGIVELRASYFSCHTANQNDQIFTFNFNLIVTRNEERVSYALNKTCSPSLPWSPREVTCEVNYLEVSVKSDVFCPLAPKPDNWDSSMQMVYGSATPGWQVVLVKEGKGMKPLNLSEARLNGYTFTVTENRLVARAAYGQPHSSRSEIDGISLEVVHAIMFSRQEWHVLLVDLVAPCTMYEAPYDGSGYMTWETPFTLYTGLHTTNFSVGLDGKLWEPHVARDIGYSVTSDGTVKVGVPYDADRVYRKSVVTEDLFDLYTCHFYMEQMATSDGGAETRTRTFRTLSSPLIRRLLLTENRTVPHEEMFTVYIGNVPGDLELVAIQLNEEKFEAPFVNSSSYALDFTVLPNNTYGCTLTVPFDDPLVIKRFSAEHGAEVNELNLIYSVMIKPKRGPFSYHTTVTALTGVPPPQFDASCSESGITFKLDHEPSNFLWEFTVGSDRLTPELAAQQGYILSNNSQTLQLEVPLFTHGYQYEHITLKGFLGTFETHVRNRQTSEVLSSSVKTCPFTAKEMIVCSKDGRMTVVADFSEVAAYDGAIVETSLLDEYCSPIDADDSKALFSFPLNSCGTRVKFNKWSVTYQNAILYSINSSTPIGSFLVQCTYPLTALSQLFSKFEFDSETAGVGHLVHPLTSVFPGAQQSSAAFPTSKPTMKPTMKQRRKSSRKPTATTSNKAHTGKHSTYWRRYIKVLSHSKDIQH